MYVCTYLLTIMLCDALSGSTCADMSVLLYLVCVFDVDTFVLNVTCLEKTTRERDNRLSG